MKCVIVTVVLVAVLAAAAPALAQNDWQFPDPYFGAVEFGGSPTGAAAERRYRAEIDPPVRPAAPGLRRRAAEPNAARPGIVRPHRWRGRLRSAN